ncbi:anti-sigma factor domain-containing protein [Parasphingorhabdus sp.]|uniref:anti-sigma factor n=1 Tax=Parasphingorhabdus sp. TaxID=2709688 RepID=UPI00359312E4
MVDLPQDMDSSELLAAELVLGLLEGEDLTNALRLRLSDPGFRQDVDAWEKRLAPLLDLIAPQAAPDHVWQSIHARLDASQAEPADRISLLTFRSRLNRWRAAALAAGTIAASLALALLVRPPAVIVPENPVQQEAPAQIIAQLSGEQEGLFVATRFDPLSGEMNVTTQGLKADEGAPVLWVVPADGTPRALGILPVNGAGAIAIEPGFQSFVQSGALLALTMEDPLGAPFVAPTTPIIATATISKI